MLSLLSAVASIGRSPSDWTPTTPLPSGYHEERMDFEILIDESKSVSLISQGTYAHGTVMFDKATSVDEPPPYDEAVGDFKEKSSKGAGRFLRVEVICRHDDVLLWAQTKVEQVRGSVNDVGIRISTPFVDVTFLPSRSHLSFHITFLFPSFCSRIARLSVDGAGWKAIGQLSLSSLHFKDVSILTKEAAVDFRALDAGQVIIENANASISGKFDVESICIKTANAKIDAAVSATGGIICQSKNGCVSFLAVEVECSLIDDVGSTILGSYSGRALDISTANAKINGEYVAVDSLKLATTNSEISGLFKGSSVVATSSNAPLCGTFVVSSSLKLLTSNAPILIDVDLTAHDSSPSTPLYSSKNRNRSLASSNLTSSARTPRSMYHSIRLLLYDSTRRSRHPTRLWSADMDQNSSANSRSVLPARPLRSR